jgi:stage III sporulation protein AG
MAFSFAAWKQKMPWLTRAIFLLFIGSALMILGNSLSGNTEKEQKAILPGQVSPSDALESSEKEMASRLQGALKQISGVGNVSVTVFLNASPTFNYASNSNSSRRSIEEKDTGGGNRVTTENNNDEQLVVVKESTATGEKPVLLSEEQSEVRGVLVVAEGAASSYIKREITSVVANLLDIPDYKVNVQPKIGGSLNDN